MKIAVIGTSNSVIKSGYFETYQALEYPHQTDLFGIGGTVISYCAFALEYFRIPENYDVIITEFSTNDAHRYVKNIVSLDYLYRYIYDVFAVIRQTGKVHINLLFGHPNTDKNCPVFDLYREIARCFGATNIEAHEIITAYTQNPDLLWLDQDHYKSNVVRPIAYVLHEQRKKLTEKNQAVKTDMPPAPLPLRKFIVKTFEDELETKPKGTSLHTLPASELKTDIIIPIKDKNTSVEGFFYKASPFTKNVTIKNNATLHACDLFKAASGFFYHYLPKEQKISITGNEITFCNAAAYPDRKTQKLSLQYNKHPFELVGITLAKHNEKEKYPNCDLSPHKYFDQEKYREHLKDYTKIFSLLKTTAESTVQNNKLASVNKSDLLFCTAQCLEHTANLKQSLYEQANSLTNNQNPNCLRFYLKNLQETNNTAKIKQWLPIALSCLAQSHFAQSHHYTALALDTCWILLTHKKFEQAEQILDTVLSDNPQCLQALSLQANLYMQVHNYKQAERVLEKCRTINENNMFFANSLLLCCLNLKKYRELQNLLLQLEEYVIACARIQYKLDFTELKPSFEQLSRDICGKSFPFVNYMRKIGYILKP